MIASPSTTMTKMTPPLALVSFIAASVLTGCVTTNEIYLADGTLGHAISCNGRELNIETCFNKAAELCGINGYETVTREGKSTGHSIAKGSTDPNSGPFATRNILVRCINQRSVPSYE